MEAIETTGTIDNSGLLRLNSPLNLKNKKVRVLVLLNEAVNEPEEKLWLQSISSNPAFDFLNDESENIYSLSNGKPLND